jgi:hypothetical protein
MTDKDKLLAEFEAAEMMLIGFLRFLRETRQHSKSPALQVCISEIEDDLVDGKNRVIKLRSKLHRPDDLDPMEYNHVS